MTAAYIPKYLRERVAEQARYRCGYCLNSEQIVGLSKSRSAQCDGMGCASNIQCLTDTMNVATQPRRLFRRARQGHVVIAGQAAGRRCSAARQFRGLGGRWRPASRRGPHRPVASFQRGPHGDTWRMSAHGPENVPEHSLGLGAVRLRRATHSPRPARHSPRGYETFRQPR
jgi:hypothetical protein